MLMIREIIWYRARCHYGGTLSDTEYELNAIFTAMSRLVLCKKCTRNLEERLMTDASTEQLALEQCCSTAEGTGVLDRNEKCSQTIST